MNRLLCSAGLFLFLSAIGVAEASTPTPGKGTLTQTSGALNYDSAVFAASNASGNAALTCQDPALPCDDYALTVTLPAGYDTAHPLDKVTISISWDDPTGMVIDFDTYLLDAAGKQVASSASSNNPEVMSVPAKGGTTNYTVRTVPFTASGSSYHGNVQLVTNAAGPVTPTQPGTPVVTLTPVAKPGDPRFHVYFPGKGQGHNGHGEFNIGYNPFSHNIMSFASSATYRTTLPQYLTPALPESCAAQWTDVTPVSTSTGLDPILFTDRNSGRTLASNFTAGANALFAYTDNDGASWTQVSVSPSNLGADHETLATGPYPSDTVSQGFAALASVAEMTQAHPPAKPYASYYCSQDIVGPATCQRSDSAGDSFGNGVVIYNGTTDPCGGLHGHAHVSYVDGAVYVPVPNCTTGVGGTVSLDSGLTWTNFVLPGTSPSATDPSIAIDAGNTVYECYSNGSDGSAFAQVSTDHGKTWSKKFDLGASYGLQNTVFPHAEAGKAGRASCTFDGTTTIGNHQAADFPGIWYPFIATTKDGGVTWTTVNISPNDPVQGAGGIWNQGGAPLNRNLLDFNEGTQDEHGRTIFGYDDGCDGDCIRDPTYNSFIAESRLAVQSGGYTLLEDVNEPTAPNASCLAGRRNTTQSILNWAIPDNGGAPINNYKVYRSTSAAGPFAYVGQTNSDKNAYVDQSVDPTVPKYYYQVTAFNSGVTTEGKVSNIVELPITADPVPESSCVLPGITATQGDDNVTGTGGTAPSDAQNIESVQIAEPANLPDDLVFTIRVKSLATLPPSTQWLVLFTLADGIHFVEMTTEGSNAATPVFKYGTVSVAVVAITTVTTYTVAGDIDPRSKYDAATNTIQLIVPRSTFGTGNLALVPGTELAQLEGRTVLTTSSQAMGAGGRRIDNTVVNGYLIRGAGVCKAATTPSVPTVPTNPVPPVVITPNPSTVQTAASNDTGRFGGGALGLGLLLPLAGLALRRRRQKP